MTHLTTMYTIKTIREAQNYMGYCLDHWNSTIKHVKIEECGSISNSIGLYVSLKRNFKNKVFLKVGSVCLKSKPTRFYTRVWVSIIIGAVEHVLDITEYQFAKQTGYYEELAYTVGGKGDHLAPNGKIIRGEDPDRIVRYLGLCIADINLTEKINSRLKLIS